MKIASLRILGIHILVVTFPIPYLYQSQMPPDMARHLPMKKLLPVENA